MSTMEHLFMQIFERKNWIAGQLRQQIESHVQFLAYNLLADGGRPPPWMWTTETAEPGCPDIKELKREQLISEILLPHLQATTPSMNHNNLSTLPALKGTNVSQPSSFFNEICVSNQILYAEPSDEVIPHNFLKDCERDSHVIGLKAVEANAEYDPLAKIQHSRSRQRDLENRLNKKAKISRFGDESTIDQYTGRMTRSRVASLKPDNVEETSVMKNSLAFDNVDGGQATRSRSASQKLDSLHKLLKPAEHLKPVEYGAQKASEDQMGFWSAVSANMDAPEVDNIDDAMAPHRCGIQTAVEVVASNASSPGNSKLKMTCNAAPELPQTNSLVEAKRLLFDGIEVCGSNDSPVIALEKENQEYASEVTPLKMDMLSLKEDSFCRDSVKAHGSLACKEPQDDSLYNGEVMQRTDESDRFSDECAKENHKVVEVDNLECHSRPSSCNKKPSQAPIQSSLKPTHCISENELIPPPLVRDSSMLNYNKNVSGQQSVRHDCSSESSLGELVKHKLEDQCSVLLIDLPTSIVTSKQSMTNSLVEPKHHLLDCKKQIDLDCNSIASLGKASNGGNSEREINLDTMQLMKEELFRRASKTAHVSPAIAQKQEEVVLPAIEDTRSIDDINRGSGDVWEENSELLVLVNPKHDSQFVNCDNIPSHNLEVMSRGVSRGKCSMDSPVKCPTDENSEGLLIKETNGSLINLANNLLSVGPALLFSETDDICIEAEEAGTTAVQLGKTSVATPTLMSDPAENHDVEVECQHLPKKSTISDKIIISSKSNDSVLVSSNKAGECFSAQGTVINAGIRHVEEKLLVSVTQSMVEAHNAKAHYYLRSSCSLDKNFGSSMVNAFSVPCPDKISTQMETIKEDIYGGAKDVAEKNVIYHLETPDNIYHLETPGNTEAQIAAPEARYFLRSLSSQKKNLGSCRLVGMNDAHSSKPSMETVAPAWEISWPKRRKVDGRSNNILATSPRMRFKPLLHAQKGGGCRSKISSKNALGNGMKLKSSPLPSKLKSDIANAVLGSPLEVLHGSKKLCVREDGSCLKADERTMVAPLQIEHRQRVLCHDLADAISDIFLTNKAGASEMSDFNLKEFCISEDGHNLTHSESILRHKIPKSPDCYVELTEDRKMCDTEGSFHAYDSVRLSQCDVDMPDCDETMPEFEGFSIGVPSIIEDSDFYNSDIPSCAKEQDSVLEQLCSSRNLVSPSSHLSTKYKINRLPDIYQSLPAGILEHMKSSNPLHFNDVDLEQFRESEDEKFSGLLNLELEYDVPFNGKFHSHSMPSSSWHTSKPPLTPPVEKSSQKKFWGRNGTSSEIVGSNPELVCFCIDENTSTTEENENPDGLDMSKERVRSREISTNREALLDVTAVYQNAPSLVSFSKKFAERGSLESVNMESCSGAQKSVHSIVGNACARKAKVVDKEIHSLPVNGNRVRKASESISNRSSKPEISGKAKDENKSQTLQGKGCKPSNIVSNISSFIPLVQQKQQPVIAKGKREIKVKALEAAEATKRLEKKKQNEREMRKAAAKLERARLEQEKELKQKRKDAERKKRETEVAARKRQREEEERKEKVKKRRCIDEARKLQREQEEKLCAEKEERELWCKAEDEEWRKKELEEQANQQAKSEKEGEVAGCGKTTDVEANTAEVVVGGGRHGNRSFAGPDASKELNDLEKSYDMSPYGDSEVEDDEAEEEIRRKRKYIPSWARRERLNQILLSNQHLDPTEIFCRKSSFDLHEVLVPCILRLPSR